MEVCTGVYILVKNGVRSQLSYTGHGLGIDIPQKAHKVYFYLLFQFLNSFRGLMLEHSQSLALLKAKVMVPHNWDTQHRESPWLCVPHA